MHALNIIYLASVVVTSQNTSLEADESWLLYPCICISTDCAEVFCKVCNATDNSKCVSCVDGLFMTPDQTECRGIQILDLLIIQESNPIRTFIAHNLHRMIGQVPIHTYDTHTIGGTIHS